MMFPSRSYHWVSMPHQWYSGDISRCHRINEQPYDQFPVVHRDLFTPHPVLNPNKTVHQSKINALLRSRYPSGEELVLMVRIFASQAKGRGSIPWWRRLFLPSPLVRSLPSLALSLVRSLPSCQLSLMRSLPSWALLSLREGHS